MDRMKREKKISEIMKPISSSIVNEFNKNRTVKPIESSPFKPARLLTSTPKGILRKLSRVSSQKRHMKSLGERNISAIDDVDNDDDSSFHTVIDEDTESTPKQSEKVSVMTVKSRSPSPVNVTPLFTTWAPKKSRRFTIGARELKSLRKGHKFDDDDSLDDGNSSIKGVASRTRTKYGKKGGGIKANRESIGSNFIPYNANNHIIYEYFDDPNELCDRLRLLVSSRMAGNTNHMQEINSIIEELRELGCIV